MRNAIAVLAIAISASLASAADNWPQFRGPTGDGHSDATGLPPAWSETENVAWKTPIHDRGWSSPVVWENQIWMTTATADGHRLFAVCVDRRTGKIVHDVKVFDVDEPEKIAPINSYASPTPAIEAGRVYVHYGSYGTACLDTPTGKTLWQRRDLKCDHHMGPGASPILHGDMLLFHVDGIDVQYVVALDKTTGKTAWKTDRSIDYTDVFPLCRKAFCTPTIIEVAGRTQMISPGSKAVIAYDPTTGEELWKVRCFGWSMTPRPLFGHGLIYAIVDYDKPELWAIRPASPQAPGGRGDVTDTHVAWKVRQSMPSTPSLLLIDELLYMVNDDGVASCLEAKTGKVVWKERIGGNYSASPVYADGRIYFSSQTSVTTAIAPGREFKVLATSELDDPVMASPAVAGNAIFLRTGTHLYRIERR
ncbi:MAG: PQQ-binding-like beta-propeller repeat protein [Candidatus Nealsonbacteria bacterium]|nr:PQQ-binding-like beta-propeller repeat protein [Candidatus Nealsonbacteria bacterium]